MTCYWSEVLDRVFLYWIALFFRTYVIQDGISFIPSSISFNWVAILLCISWSLFIYNPWTPSCLGAFQFGILLHCFFTLSSLITTFCCSNFTISSFRSLNHLTSLFCSSSTHIPLQNVLLCLVFGMSRYYSMFVHWTRCKLSFDPLWTIY